MKNKKRNHVLICNSSLIINALYFRFVVEIETLVSNLLRKHQFAWIRLRKS